MKVLIVHNKYAATSGEEVMIRRIVELLRQHGNKVRCFYRSSRVLGNSLLWKIRAFFSGVHSQQSCAKLRKIIGAFNPDIIEVQNVYPLISPSILAEAKKYNIPVVMRVANYRPLCPTGLFMTGGQICEKCRGGREYWCILSNCEKNMFKSTGYALRNYVSRKLRLFRDNVDIFICLTEFQKAKLVAEGFPSGQCIVIPNMAGLPDIDSGNQSGDYVGFVGRISREKGISTLLDAAQKCPDIIFRAAGKRNGMERQFPTTPKNIHFVGHLSAGALREFYLHCRAVVLPSVCYEGFPNTIIEAMSFGKPVICSRIGGMVEIVDDGVNGLLFKPGNADDLAEKISYLWNKPDLCKQMGQAGRKKVLCEYNPQKYYERLIDAYQRAIAFNGENIYQACT